MRIRGEEVDLLLIQDNVPLTTITTVKSFEMTVMLRVLSEGYLGKTTMLKDEIFDGVKFRMELHIDNGDVFNLFRAIVDRARRRTPGVKINIKATLQFANGDRPVIMIPDAKFGEIPLNSPSRDGYVTVSLDGEAEDFNVLSAA